MTYYLQHIDGTVSQISADTARWLTRLSVLSAWDHSLGAYVLYPARGV